MVAIAETGTLTTEFEASLTTEILPLALPADNGANVMVKLLRSLAARVSGKVIPLILKPVPLRVAWLIVTFALLELIRVADWVRLVPTLTLPKARLVGETSSWPEDTPMPETATLTVVAKVRSAKTVSASRPPRATGRCFATLTGSVPLTEIVPLIAPLAGGSKADADRDALSGPQHQGQGQPGQRESFLRNRNLHYGDGELSRI